MAARDSRHVDQGTDTAGHPRRPSVSKGPPATLNAAGVLALQRLAGNAGVARLVGAAAGQTARGAPPLVVQRLDKNGKKKLASHGYDSDGTVAVEAWQKQAGIGDGKMNTLLSDLKTSELEEVFAADAKLFGFVNSLDEDVGQQALTKARNAKRQASAIAESNKLASVKPKNPLTVRLEATGADEKDVADFLKGEGGASLAVTTWLNTTPAEVARRTVELAIRRTARLADIQLLLTQGATYDALNVIDWAKSYGLPAVAEAFVETAGDPREDHVQIWLASGAKGSSDLSFKKLVHLEARVKADPSKLAVYRADRTYVGSQDPPSRTGFLRANLGGSVAEVHTHWNENKRKLVSMHVQADGANSTEIQKWEQFFPTVPGVVRDAHNKVKGTAFKPTTNPVDADLTL